MSQTYVCEGVEVTLTGRTASQKITTKISIGNAAPAKITLHEITPLDQNVHGNWKRWVDVTSLFVIEEQ